MSDIIKLLPDSIANQIAAGEVIQRPASVIKELVENSIDAKATEITINIKDAGRTLIQVIDNGTGMSETDARLSFERHATSKIKEANDLFKINTMGFRGEALASIASVSQVELKTRKENDELGIKIQISASDVILQESVNCPKGSNFQVKNLFFNIPARRKFLKADTTEFHHIIDELQRIALTNENVSFQLLHNGTEVYNLPIENIRQRIVRVFGKSINQNIISINNQTEIVKITGFIGKPEHSKKIRGQQYFFANGRFMRHQYFYHAVVSAYKNIMQPDMFPTFFIFLEVNPSAIDINIHPTKTEIKFEDEKFIYQLLHVTVKESLGKFNIVPSIDFDVEPDFEIAPKSNNIFIRPPEPKLDYNYNPFKKSENAQSYSNTAKSFFEKTNTENWEKLFESSKNEDAEIIENTNYPPTDLGIKAEQDFDVLIVQNKYAIFYYKQQVLSVNLRRALYRINFDNFLIKISNNKSKSQKLLYPEEIELSSQDYMLLNEIYDELSEVGFDITESKPNTISVNGVPSEFENSNYKEFIENVLETFKNSQSKIKDDVFKIIADSLSKTIKNSQLFFNKESAKTIIFELFNCTEQTYSPNGKQIIKHIEL